MELSTGAIDSWLQLDKKHLQKRHCIFRHDREPSRIQAGTHNIWEFPTLSSELSLIVLEPVNNSTDYKHLESYNISANCTKNISCTRSYSRDTLHNATHSLTFWKCPPGHLLQQCSLKFWTSSKVMLCQYSHSHCLLPLHYVGWSGSASTVVCKQN